MKSWQRVLGSLLLLGLCDCIDRAIVGYNCPEEGCDAGQVEACVTTLDGDVCCSRDLDCALEEDKQRCHPQDHVCVECTKDSECAADEPYCVEQRCADCRNPAECRSQMQCDGECEDAVDH